MSLSPDRTAMPPAQSTRGTSRTQVPHTPPIAAAVAAAEYSLSRQMQEAGYMPVLQETPSLSRRIRTARQDSAPSLRHSRCSVSSLLGLEILRIFLWIGGNHPEGDLWIIHRVCMLTDFFVLFISIPLAYLGVEQKVIRSGIMGMSMCWIASMCLVDVTALVFLCLYIIPLLTLQVGEQIFWHALISLLDVWACMLIISNLLQAVIGVSVWRMYREMRIQRLYPANANEELTYNQVYKAEVCCEPEDVAKCNDGCDSSVREYGCDGCIHADMDLGTPIVSKPILSNQSDDHQRYRHSYASPCNPISDLGNTTTRESGRRDAGRELFSDECADKHLFHLGSWPPGLAPCPGPSSINICGKVQKPQQALSMPVSCLDFDGYGEMHNQSYTEMQVDVEEKGVEWQADSRREQEEDEVAPPNDDDLKLRGHALDPTLALESSATTVSE